MQMISGRTTAKTIASVVVVFIYFNVFEAA